MIFQKIIAVFLWIVFGNFVMFIRVLFYNMNRLINGEKYFNIESIILHIIGTILGLVFGIGLAVR